MLFTPEVIIALGFMSPKTIKNDNNKLSTISTINKKELKFKAEQH